MPYPPTVDDEDEVGAEPLGEDVVGWVPAEPSVAVLLAPPTGEFPVLSVTDVFAPLPALSVDGVAAALLGLLTAPVFVLPEPAPLLGALTGELLVGLPLFAVVGAALSVVLLGAVVACAAAALVFVEEAEVGSDAGSTLVEVAPAAGGLALSEGPLRKDSVRSRASRDWR